MEFEPIQIMSTGFHDHLEDVSGASTPILHRLPDRVLIYCDEKEAVYDQTYPEKDRTMLLSDPYRVTPMREKRAPIREPFIYATDTLGISDLHWVGFVPVPLSHFQGTD